MREVDREKIGTLVSSIKEALSRLEDVRTLSKTEFFDDTHKQDSAKYNFIVGIEAAIDIANHLISRKGFRAPEDYADTFRVLEEVNILDKEFSLELEKMARFRNRLVHLYWKIDTGEMWKILQTKLGDFDLYLSRIGVFLAASDQCPSTGHLWMDTIECSED